MEVQEDLSGTPPPAEFGAANDDASAADPRPSSPRAVGDPSHADDEDGGQSQQRYPSIDVPAESSQAMDGAMAEKSDEPLARSTPADEDASLPGTKPTIESLPDAEPHTLTPPTENIEALPQEPLTGTSIVDASVPQEEEEQNARASVDGEEPARPSEAKDEQVVEEPHTLDRQEVEKIGEGVSLLSGTSLAAHEEEQPPMMLDGMGETSLAEEEQTVGETGSAPTVHDGGDSIEVEEGGDGVSLASKEPFSITGRSNNGEDLALMTTADASAALAEDKSSQVMPLERESGGAPAVDTEMAGLPIREELIPGEAGSADENTVLAGSDEREGEVESGAALSTMATANSLETFGTEQKELEMTHGLTEIPESEAVTDGEQTAVQPLEEQADLASLDTAATVMDAAGPEPAPTAQPLTDVNSSTSPSYTDAKQPEEAIPIASVAEATDLLKSDSTAVVADPPREEAAMPAASDHSAQKLDPAVTTIAEAQPEVAQDTIEAPPATSSGPPVEAAVAVTAASLSPKRRETGVASSAPPTTDADAVKESAKQAAVVPLVLKINKELIRLCVDLQGKELGSDVLFKDAALRLQSNLAFLASIADRSTKTVSSSMKDAPSTPLNDEHFPPTLHAPQSMLPKLYQLLQTYTKPKGASGAGEGAEGSKRERPDSQEGKRKKVKEEKHLQAVAEASAPIPSLPLTSAAVLPPRQGMDSNGLMAGVQQPAVASLPNNGAEANNAQMNNNLNNLTQAFGQNAVMNLNALQAHYRGQPQAVVSYMEANIPSFRTLPIQMQLQQMSNIQNAAMQRQRQQQQQQQQPVQNQQGHFRRQSAAQSPGADSPGARMANRNTQSPMPMNTASPGTQMQQQARPGTPASQNPFAHMSGSPAASIASPAPHLMAPSSTLSYSSPQTGMMPFNMANASAPSTLANVPAHLQQHFLQQFQQQQQLQQQQQYYTPSSAFSPPQNQANGSVWPPPPSS